MKKTGAEILWECLLREGVEVVFGYPGGANMPIYDAMLSYPVHHVLVRHEQGAVHAADGYARASGKVGVALATSGPGATNCVTGIATAHLDSVPLVVFTGQVKGSQIGHAAHLPEKKPVYEGHSGQIKKACDLIASAKRPVIYAGGGVVISNASKELREFVRTHAFPVTTTLRGRGVF